MSLILKKDMAEAASNDLDKKMREFDSNGMESEDEFEVNETYKSVFNDDFMLDSAEMSDGETEGELLRDAARIYLNHDAQNNIDQAINESKNAKVVESTENWHQSFFRAGSKVFFLCAALIDHSVKNIILL